MLTRTVALLALLGASTSAAAAAERNVVKRVHVDASGDGRAIRIETASEPTFTVFRLQNPMRVVVDISGGDVGKLDAPVAIEDGVVSQVATQQFNADGFFIGRLVVSFERDVSYEVRAEGTSVVIRAGSVGDAKIERAIPPPAAPVDLAAKERIEAQKKLADEAAERAASERKQADAAAEKARACSST